MIAEADEVYRIEAICRLRSCTRIRARHSFRAFFPDQNLENRKSHAP